MKSSYFSTNIVFLVLLANQGFVFSATFKKSGTALIGNASENPDIDFQCEKLTADNNKNKILEQTALLSQKSIDKFFFLFFSSKIFS